MGQSSWGIIEGLHSQVSGGEERDLKSKSDQNG